MQRRKSNAAHEQLQFPVYSRDLGDNEFGLVLMRHGNKKGVISLRGVEAVLTLLFHPRVTKSIRNHNPS